MGRAMREETSAPNKNCTWKLVPKPKNVELVTCKWVYKLKKKVDGTMDNHKLVLLLAAFLNNMVYITRRPSDECLKHSCHTRVFTTF